MISFCWPAGKPLTTSRRNLCLLNPHPCHITGSQTKLFRDFSNSTSVSSIISCMFDPFPSHCRSPFAQLATSSPAASDGSRPRSPPVPGDPRRLGASHGLEPRREEPSETRRAGRPSEVKKTYRKKIWMWFSYAGQCWTRCTTEKFVMIVDTAV